MKTTIIRAQHKTIRGFKTALALILALGLIQCSDTDPGDVGPPGGDTPAADTQADTGTGQDSDTVEQDTLADGSETQGDAKTDAGDAPGDTDALSDAPSDDTVAPDTGLPVDTTSDILDTTPEPDTTPELDTAQDTDSGPVGPEPLWLLSIDNSSHMLQIVDVLTGEATDLCKLTESYSYPSLTFSRQNGLYASRSGSSLDRIDPCTCKVTHIGGFSGFTGVNGITADPGENLFGVAATQDETITVSAINGEATSLGPFGQNFTTTGATWSQQDQTLYAINGADNGLYEISPKTGAATLITILDYNFGTVGIEVHPKNNVLYACSSAGDLLSVDPLTGQVTVIGPMGQNTSCTNLAAPWSQLGVDCLSLP